MLPARAKRFVKRTMKRLLPPRQCKKASHSPIQRKSRPQEVTTKRTTTPFLPLHILPRADEADDMAEVVEVTLTPTAAVAAAEAVADGAEAAPLKVPMPAVLHLTSPA